MRHLSQIAPEHCLMILFQRRSLSFGPQEFSRQVFVDLSVACCHSPGHRNNLDKYKIAFCSLQNPVFTWLIAFCPHTAASFPLISVGLQQFCIFASSWNISHMPTEGLLYPRLFGIKSRFLINTLKDSLSRDATGWNSSEEILVFCSECFCPSIMHCGLYSSPQIHLGRAEDLTAPCLCPSRESVHGCKRLFHPSLG